MGELNVLRLKGLRALTVLIWTFVVLIAVSCAFSSQGWLPLLMALATAILPTVAVASGRTDSATRVAFGATMPLFPAIMLFQWMGANWQIDIHMIFFVVIAALSVLADWRPIVAAAAVSAVHHLLGDLLMPSLVFPDAGSIVRVLFHAVIVVVETGVLAGMAIQLEKLVLSQAQTQDERERLAEANEGERNRVRAEQDLIISEIGKGLHALADGDFEKQLSTPFPGSYEALRNDFNNMVVELRGTLQSVADTAQSIESGSTEISNAAREVATRTESQAENIDGAHREAAEGNRVVQKTTQAMSEIERSTKEITQITDLIDGIAFQTNLLALNAGVEAARAGDAGKGFAVVASEVRALAQRSADAARNIKGLISASASQVQSGVALVDATGKVFDRLSERISEIHSSVQQNATMVEKTTSSTTRLADVAKLLASLVSRFNVGSGQRHAGRSTFATLPRARSAPAPQVVGALALAVDAPEGDWAEF